MIEPKKQKDLTKSSEGTKEVDQASKKEESKTVEGLKNADKVKSDLIGGIEKAITTMENWDKLTPEERLSVINTLKNLASENK